MAKNIFVAMPIYTGEVCAQTMHALLYACEEAHAQGWTLKAENVRSRISDADIGMARNAFLGWFLNSDCTDLVFIDTDVSWPQGVFTRLMSHSVDFVAGLYPAKREDQDKYCVIWPPTKNMRNDLESGFPLLEAEGVGFGFARITRRGLEKVLSKLTIEHFQDPLMPDVKCPWLFEFSWTKEGNAKSRLSEDYTFCKRWRAGGGKIWVDPMLCIDHIGKKTWQGNVIEHLRAETYRAIAIEAA